MNLLITRSFTRMTALTAITLFLIQGCASNTPRSDAVATPVDTGQPGTANTQLAEDEPQAIPFEEVLKADQAKAQAKAEPKPIPKKTPKPTAVAEKPKLKTAPPLRPPQKPKPKQPEIKAPEIKAPQPVQLPELPELTDQDAIEFTLEQLPITIHDTWILESDLANCTLRTVPAKLDDGAGMTPISLQLTKDAWMINTKSDIDLSYTGTGLFLDNGAQMNLETLVKDTNIAITKQRQALTQAMKSATSVKVSLGFWPTWPVSEAKTINLPVTHFAQAHQAWEVCNQRISAR